MRNNSITRPVGFLTNALNCGIKKKGKLDLALLYSVVECNAAAVFTKNTFKAAPVKISQKHIKGKSLQAIIVNSGNANCFTKQSDKLADDMAFLAANELQIKKHNVLVASTGIIGRRLPIEKINFAKKELVKGLSKEKGNIFAKAILTTDTKIKQVVRSFNLSGKKVTIAGCAKGSGMINPDMATMLCFITTDAAIEKKVLDNALKNAVDMSFNCITIDAQMSTNDSVFALANGLAFNKIIKSKGNACKKFEKVLSEVCLDLAKQIVADGEGATKFVQLTVKQAKSKKEAKVLAKSVADSVLFKTAIHGGSNNLGRIIQALGQTGIVLDEKKIKLTLSSLKKKNIYVTVSLGLGKYSAVVYTCDLSKKYIDINAAYN